MSANTCDTRAAIRAAMEDGCARAPWLLAGLVAALFLCAAGLPITIAQSATLTPEAVEQMATIVTERDSAIRVLEVRGLLSANAAIGVQYRFVYKYESPNKVALFMSRPEDQAAYASWSDGNAIVYDPDSGRVITFSDVLPIVSVAFQNENVQLEWSYTSKAGAQEKTLVRIDFPSMIRNLPKVVSRRLEVVGGERHRLIETLENGWKAIYTVMPSSPVAFRGVDVRDNDGNTTLLIDLRINDAAQLQIPELPTAKKMGEFFSLEEGPLPEDLPGMLRFMTLMYQMMVIGAGTEAEKTQSSLDKAMGMKHDWPAMWARYIAVLPKLRALLAMPQ